MKAMIRHALLAAGGLLAAAPAHAAESIKLPDPSGGALFALGVVGLLVGRHVARKRPRD